MGKGKRNEGGQLTQKINTAKGYKLHGVSSETLIARLREENRQLKHRLDQYESHRNYPLVRDLKLTLEALEEVGIYGWPKRDAGSGGGAGRAGTSGDKEAIGHLVTAERIVRGLDRRLGKWLEDREFENQHGVKAAV